MSVFACQCEMKAQECEDVSVFAQSSSHVRQWDVCFCLLSQHACPPPTRTLVPFHLVYICLLKLVCFTSVYNTARVSWGPPRRAQANAAALSDYFAGDSTYLMWYKGSREIGSNSKMLGFNVPRLADKNSDPPQSWFRHPMMHCFGCEGWEGCVNFGELWANFKGP